MQKTFVSASIGLITLLLFAQVMFGQATATVARSANLRAGPGTTYAVVGGLKAGATVTIVGSNGAGDWYQLDNGKWIAKFLVKGVDGDIAPITSTLTITPTKITPTGIAKPLTPTPTATKAPPTQTPTRTPAPNPNLVEGTGDSIITINKSEGPMMLYILGNFSSRYFGVENYGAGGQIGLLVNTSEPYEGIVPLDFRQNEHTTRLSIKAEGEWAIEIRQVTAARSMAVPGSIAGRGDEVILLEAPPDTLSIAGNAEGGYFGVTAYGSISDLLVNTTDMYEGTVIVGDPKALVLVVRAIGDWAIESTAH